MSEPIVLVKLSAPTEIVAYACGKCGVVAGSVMRDGDAAMDMAVACCAPRVCPCGAPLERSWGKCDACMKKESADRLQKRFDVAEKMTIKEWSEEGFPEYVIDPHGRAGNDGFCPDLEELRDYYLNLASEAPSVERPTWAWATTEMRGIRPSADDVIEGVAQEMHEDAYENFDADDLQKRLNEWFEAQDARAFMEDDGVAILLGDDFWKEDQ